MFFVCFYYYLFILSLFYFILAAYGIVSLYTPIFSKYHGFHALDSRKANLHHNEVCTKKKKKEKEKAIQRTFCMNKTNMPRKNELKACSLPVSEN